MVDLETMGNTPGSVIVSIGACHFNPYGNSDPAAGEMGISKFYSNITIESCLKAGLHVDGSTILWWLKRDDDARKALLHDPQTLDQVLVQFNSFLKNINPRIILWSHGATFDAVLLSVAMSKVGVEPNWKYWDVRCTRTIYDAAKYRLPNYSIGHHIALDDAIVQARGVQISFRNLGIKEGNGE